MCSLIPWGNANRGQCTASNWEQTSQGILRNAFCSGLNFWMLQENVSSLLQAAVDIGMGILGMLAAVLHVRLCTLPALAWPGTRCPGKLHQLLFSHLASSGIFPPPFCFFPQGTHTDRTVVTTKGACAAWGTASLANTWPSTALSLSFSAVKVHHQPLQRAEGGQKSKLQELWRAAGSAGEEQAAAGEEMLCLSTVVASLLQLPEAVHLLVDFSTHHFSLLL